MEYRPEEKEYLSEVTYPSISSRTSLKVKC